MAACTGFRFCQRRTGGASDPGLPSENGGSYRKTSVCGKRATLQSIFVLHCRCGMPLVAVSRCCDHIALQYCTMFAACRLLLHELRCCSMLLAVAPCNDCCAKSLVCDVCGMPLVVTIVMLLRHAACCYISFAAIAVQTCVGINNICQLLALQ